jgi:hypothetical protein
MKYASDLSILKLSATLGLALWLLMSGEPAHADLIKTDDLVVDTSTGLEWLNLTRTQGLSADQVFAQLGPGGQFAGFQYATRVEFVTLFTEVFGTPLLVNINGGLDLNATENFANLFGPTDFAVINGQRLPTIAGFFDATPNPRGSAIGIEFFYTPDLNGALTGASDTADFDPDFSSPTNASFLVRPVPEPSLLLPSVALIGLAAVMLRRKASAKSSTERRESGVLRGCQ